MKYYLKVGDLLDWYGYCVVTKVTSSEIIFFFMKSKHFEKYYFDSTALKLASIEVLFSV